MIELQVLVDRHFEERKYMLSDDRDYDIKDECIIWLLGLNETFYFFSDYGLNVTIEVMKK